MVTRTTTEEAKKSFMVHFFFSSENENNNVIHLFGCHLLTNILQLSLLILLVVIKLIPDHQLILLGYGIDIDLLPTVMPKFFDTNHDECSVSFCFPA
jgi:hypothetical protein